MDLFFGHQWTELRLGSSTIGAPTAGNAEARGPRRGRELLAAVVVIRLQGPILCQVGRRLVFLIVVVGLGSSVLAIAAAPQAPDRRGAPLAGRTMSKFTPQDAEAEKRRVVRRLASRFGHKLKVPVLLSFHNQPLPSGKIARTIPARRDRQGNWQAVRDDPMEACVVELGPKVSVLPTKAFVGNFAHEITHCFQLQAAGVQAGYDMSNTATWLAEGSAEWASYQHVGAAWAGAKYWKAYITQPETGLFTRDYDALGFFAHIARRANAWKIMYAMWREWQKPAGEENPFLLAQKSLGKSQAAQDRFLQSWSMSYARRRDLGSDWQMVGAGIPGPTMKASPTKVSIGRFDLSMHTLAHASVKLLQLDVAPGLVIRVSHTGFGAIRWLNTKRETRFARERHFDYCIIRCVCPMGETLDPAVQTVGARSALMALTGGAGRGFVAIRVRSAPEVCIPGTTTGTGRDPCIYSVGEATALIAARVGGHHPVEDVEVQFFRTAPPIPKRLQPPKRALTACLYISSFGDAIWVDRLVDGSLWISYIGYPRDEVLSGTGCC
jgi:hypothetical protein